MGFNYFNVNRGVKEGPLVNNTCSIARKQSRATGGVIVVETPLDTGINEASYTLNHYS